MDKNEIYKSVITIGISLFSAIAHELNTFDKKTFHWLNFIGALMSSIIAGMVTSWLLQLVNSPELLTMALTSVAAYSGGTFVEKLGNRLESKIGKTLEDSVPTLKE
jgi:ABC-type uncharacterized transport system permease subunit